MAECISFAPEACACLSFVSIFGPMLGLAPLAREALARCLREPSVHRQLIELQWRMMQPIALCPEGDAWYAELRTVLAKGVLRLAPPLATRVASMGYAELSDDDRLAILLALCEAVAPEVDPQDLQHLGGDASAMRTEPIGTDSIKRSYYWFGDDHLFRETPAPPAAAAPAAGKRASGGGGAYSGPRGCAEWLKVATGAAEFEQLSESAELGRTGGAAALRAALRDIAQDELRPREAERERQLRKAERAQAQPHTARLSARQQARELERLERLEEQAEEERLRELQQQAQREREEAAAERRARKRQRDDELLLALRAEDDEHTRLRAAEADALAALRAEWARADVEEATASVLRDAEAQGLQLTRAQLQDRAQLAVDAHAALVRRAAFELSGRASAHERTGGDAAALPTDADAEPSTANVTDTEVTGTAAGPNGHNATAGEATWPWEQEPAGSDAAAVADSDA